MKDFLKSFFGSPVLPTLTAILTVLAIAFTTQSSPSDSEINGKMASKRLEILQSDSAPPVSGTATTQPSGLTPVVADITHIPVITRTTSAEQAFSPTETALYSDLSSQTTATEISGETTTTTTGEPHTYDYSYISAGESPNSSYYQERLAVIGDSIASGFNAYGYIPYEHNIAKESLAIWNMDSYYFDIDGYYAGVIDTADYVNSPLYLISIGMNDIYGCTAEEYGASMLGIAQQVLERVPTATIVVGAITPIADWNGYTTNETIRSFNYALQNAIEGAGNPQILFFDTYTVLADPYTLALGDDHSGGDGMHLSNYSYSYILNCLFNFLDSADVTEQIKIHDTTGY
ncbi:MAG: SGNH/GDSL hydrolase family protein [Ruminococcus flavefaciens]|nr:SGNH/GDSL hydrolase family protein [Ruminococcus flavefaciens]MCM1229900.1 SGNH/GDSL hydrolase family protein [Ruminococcus flavefaciens]